MNATPTVPARRRAGAVLLAAGLVLLLVSMAAIVRPADAASSALIADTPAALSIEVSRAVVPEGEGRAVFLLDEAVDPRAWGAPAALSAVPGSASLLFTSPATPSAAVLAELDRALAPDGVVYAIGVPGIVVGLEARGLTVVAVDVSDAAGLSLAVADQTFGVPAGTSQRVVTIAAQSGSHLLAAAANVHGANLAIPVVAFGAGQATDISPTVVREIRAVADPALVSDGALASAGAPAVTRLFDEDPGTVAGSLDDLLMAEPRDGDLADRLGRTAVAIEAGETRPAPAILAAVVAARDALDGFDAKLELVASPADASALDPGNGVTFLGLTHGPVSQPAPPAAPLPVTGGGMVLGAVLVVAGLRLRR